MFAYALFGSSRQLMTGPDAATCIMAAASIGAVAGGDPQRYMALMVALTLMIGLFNIVAGIARLGFIANFLSQPILVGYLNGIALIILVGQLPKLFGFASEASGFFPKVVEFVERLDATHPPTLVLGAGLLVLLVALQRLAPRLPGALIVVAVGIVTVAVLALQHRGVAVLGSVPAGFPSLRLPSFDFAEFENLFRDAAGITLISFTSGVLTAKSFARRNRYDIDANQELMAFGACNLASGLAQGFPVTGAASRTAVNDATLLQIIAIEKHQVRVKPIDQERRNGLGLGVIGDVVEPLVAGDASEDRIVGPGSDRQQPRSATTPRQARRLEARREPRHRRSCRRRTTTRDRSHSKNHNAAKSNSP